MDRKNNKRSKKNMRITSTTLKNHWQIDAHFVCVRCFFFFPFNWVNSYFFLFTFDLFRLSSNSIILDLSILYHTFPTEKKHEDLNKTCRINRNDKRKILMKSTKMIAVLLKEKVSKAKTTFYLFLLYVDWCFESECMWFIEPFASNSTDHTANHWTIWLIKFDMLEANRLNKKDKHTDKCIVWHQRVCATLFWVR